MHKGYSLTMINTFSIKQGDVLTNHFITLSRGQKYNKNFFRFFFSSNFIEVSVVIALDWATQSKVVLIMVKNYRGVESDDVIKILNENMQCKIRENDKKHITVLSEAVILRALEMMTKWSFKLLILNMAQKY